MECIDPSRAIKRCQLVNKVKSSYLSYWSGNWGNPVEAQRRGPHAVLDRVTGIGEPGEEEREKKQQFDSARRKCGSTITDRLCGESFVRIQWRTESQNSKQQPKQTQKKLMGKLRSRQKGDRRNKIKQHEGESESRALGNKIKDLGEKKRRNINHSFPFGGGWTAPRGSIPRSVRTERGQRYRQTDGENHRRTRLDEVEIK